MSEYIRAEIVAAELEGLLTPAMLPLGLRNRLKAINEMLERVHGELVSRQVIAVAIFAWKLETRGEQKED